MSTLLLVETTLKRSALLLLGYLLPAYRCCKLIKPTRGGGGRQSGPPPRSTSDLGGDLQRYICYWVLVAIFTSVEYLVDPLVATWIPLYTEAKTAGLVYLWHNGARGAELAFHQLLRPLMLAQEARVDQWLDASWTLLSHHGLKLWSFMVTTVEDHFANAMTQAGGVDAAGGARPAG
eukprot:jgi/Mesvir1/27645/Mv07374-RA.1